MLIIPAIDIKNKKCVRLYQGRFDNETIFNNDPIKVARDFLKSGASWLHIIDLDGARKGQPKNQDIINEINEQVPIKIECGGGLRSEQDLKKINADKFIISPGDLANKKLPLKKIIISIDARNGQVMINGWQKKLGQTAEQVMQEFYKKGISDFIYTDIKKDGTLLGPNLIEINRLRNQFKNISLTVAGGIASAKDINDLKKIGIDKVIIGKALYTNPLLKKYVSQKNYTVS